MERKEIQDEDKIKSAYALNLCTVSISQIVDYDDLNILEQEYDAILNNLNLEKIIKNDSLLNILKQILDTVTYFKMEDIDKKIIEQEYQQETKNALWAAVPNFGLIVAGGSPLTMAISLASQVGIGYMNYRRNRNDREWKRKKNLLKLQRAAMEQLNGLRRELFTTAWNLAEEYEFPDKYRLTEKQIKQYNNILDDSDEVRKYERLDFIKENFEAYPPFWYFFGSTANYIANDKRLEISDSTRKFYKDKALDYFEKYDNLDRYNILRENQITSSFALEYADLLLERSNPDVSRVKALIDKAAAMAPNSYDVLELCAIAYLRINDRGVASSLLKFLVNEGYNKVVNAQLLSGIFVHDKNIGEYEILKTRVAQQYLYPMPKEGQTPEQAQEEFVQKQKVVLKRKYACVIDELVEKYAVQWNRIYSTFNYSEEYPDSFFFIKNELVRMSTAVRTFGNEEAKSTYLDNLKNQNIQIRMVDVLNESITGLFSLPALIGSQFKETVVDIIRKNIIEKNEDLSQLFTNLASGKFSIDDYRYLQKFSLESLYGEKTIQNIKNKINLYIEHIASENLANEEGRLRAFCAKEKIEDPELVLGKNRETQFSVTHLPFTPEIFGAEAVLMQKNVEKINSLVVLASDFVKNIQLKDDMLQIFLRGENNFDNYFANSIFNGMASIKAHSLMVFRDLSSRKFDLIFTTDGIVSINKSRIQALTRYDEIRLEDDNLILYNTNFFTNKKKYFSSAIDSSVIFQLTRKIGGSIGNRIDNYLEFIENLDGKNLSNWFKLHSKNLPSGSKMIISYPDKQIISSFGINTDIELNSSKNIIQFIYDDRSKYILSFRIIEFKNIDTELQANLEEHDGIIHIVN